MFTPKSFKNTVSSSPSVLHIATHGFFYERAKDNNNLHTDRINPLLQSGLLFAGAQHTVNGNRLPGNEDGIATALEISNMQLPNTKLVVLSACETALGNIEGDEGVYGLQRAFRAAGASSIMTSLWKVDDVATRDFMIAFYQHYLKTKDINAAYIVAQKVIKEKYKHPYFWGAFVMVGK